MRIPSKGRIAVCAMMDLTFSENDKPLTIAGLAEKQDVSVSYLEQLFADLRSADLVVGMRGPGGGYQLSRAASQISIAQIIDAIDDKALKTEKINQEYKPDLIWSDFAGMAYDFLDNLTLSKFKPEDLEPEADQVVKQDRHAELVSF